jgi:hypothetical protein
VTLPALRAERSQRFLCELAAGVGLGVSAWRLARLARWGLQLEPHGALAAPGGSKIGGVPDLQPDIDWPTAPGMRSIFVAQIAVHDMVTACLDTRGLFSGVELVSFFAFQQAPRREVVGGRVLVGSAGAEVVRRPVADLTQGIIGPERGLSMLPVLTLPTWHREADFPSWELGLCPSDHDAYLRLVAALDTVQGTKPRGHRLLGHPDRISHPILQEAALLRSWEDDAGWWVEQDALESAASEWRLLLRIDLEGGDGAEWHTAGTLYFCIAAEDLRRGRYDRATAFTARDDADNS